MMMAPDCCMDKLHHCGRRQRRSCSVVRATISSLCSPSQNLILVILSLLMTGRVPAQNQGGISVGLKPLPELGNVLYQGYQGGLYSAGVNMRPAAHDSVGRALAQQVLPLNQSGIPDASNGRVVLLSIGMSNTTQEFTAFKPMADGDPAKNSRLTIVDGAQGGQTAAVISNSSAAFWATIDQRLQAAGVTRQQVQVAWVKEADAGPTKAFPVHAQVLQTELESIVRILKSFYPNIRIAYLSSRIYAGYATSDLNPEPFAYESGFSVQWLIQKQINGDTSLAYAQPRARSPWLAWGPYLWADGLTPRSDGLVWQAVDFQTDGTHPSSSGQKKVASLLLNFFKSDPTAVPWFLKSGATGVESRGSAVSPQWSLSQNYPNPFNPKTAISYQLLAQSFVNLGVYDVLGRKVATLVNDIRPAGEHVVRWDAVGMPSGIYVCQLWVSRDYAPGQSNPAEVLVDAKRMLLLK